MSEGQQKSGMSTAAKVVIGLVAAGIIGLAVCCGGVWWFGSKAINMTQDPAEIEAKVASIASIDVPAGWEPVMGMEMNMGFQMKMAAYSPDQTQQGRALVLMQMKMEGANEQQMEQQMEMQMGQQNMNQDISVESSETRTYTIDGQDRDFEFAVGTDSSGNSVHQVTGVFPGKDGTAMLMMIEDDANWDEEAVVQMIESISTQ